MARKKTTNIENDAHALLLAKSEATGKSRIELASQYISLGVLYNLQDEGWEDRIKKSLEEIDKKKRRARRG